VHPFTRRKLELKDMALKIRAAKNDRKNANYAAARLAENLGASYREGHIAYCLARGRTLEQIESKVSDDKRRRRDARMMTIQTLADLLKGEADRHEQDWQERLQDVASQPADLAAS